MSLSSVAWLGLLVLPVTILLVHFFARAHRVHPVSSVRLWRDVSLAMVEPRRFSRPRGLTRLLLTLSILTCLSLAAARPWIVSHRPVPALVVILDSTQSMAAESGSGIGSRIDIGRSVALAALREAAETPLRILMLAGDPMRAMTARPGDDTPFETVLRDLTLSGDEPALSSSVEVATELVRAAGGGRVLVVSDFCGPPSSLSEARAGDVELELVSVAEVAPNIAVSSLVISRHARPGTMLEAAVTVANTGDAPRAVTLTGTLDGTLVAEKTLSIPSDETATWRFDVEYRPAALLETLVRPGGAVACDDAARRVLPRTFSLLRDENRPLSAEIAAAMQVLPLPISSGDELPVRLFRERLPAELPAHWLFLASGSDDAPRRRGPAVALEVAGPGGDFLGAYEPVLIDPAVDPVGRPPEGAVPVAFVRGQPAIAIFEASRSRGVWCGIPLEATDLAERGALPLVLVDMLDWVAGTRPTTHRQFRDRVADLTANPPIGARPAAAFLRESRTRPVDLKAVLLWVAAGLLVAEGGRRWIGARKSPSVLGENRVRPSREPAPRLQGVRARSGP
jgi:hypothetical protein